MKTGRALDRIRDAIECEGYEMTEAKIKGPDGGFVAIVIYAKAKPSGEVVG